MTKKLHKKDTRGKRLLKKKRNKIGLYISPWTKMMINSLPDLDKQISLSMYGRGSYPPGGIFFLNEVDNLLSPKPVETSEEYIPRYPVLTLRPSKEFSQELIDFLNAPGKEIIVVGNNFYDKATGLKEEISWLDEASDMADAFAYSLDNKSFLERQRKYIRENGVMGNFNSFDVQPKTIAVVSSSKRMYDEFIEGYPDYLIPAFIRIYDPNQHRGLTFTDYHVLDCPKYLVNTSLDIKHNVRRPFYKHEIYNFGGFRFLIKPKGLTIKTTLPKPRY